MNEAAAVTAQANKAITKKSYHLASRADGKYLPLSVDELPSNAIQKIVQKLQKKPNFDNLADLKLKDTNEANFVSQLRGFDVTKVDKIVGLKGKKEATRPTQETSKNESTEVHIATDGDP